MATGSILEGLSAAGGAAGLVALLGSAFAYGKVVQRLTNVEKEVEKLSNLGETVTRIDERTKATATSVEEIKRKLERHFEIPAPVLQQPSQDRRAST